MSIWALQGESPTGPFTSPLDRALVGFDTPGVRGNSDPDATDVVWLFDPAVLVNDDGEGYLYFGGGVPTTGGGADDPDTARVIKLGDDMVSVEGEAKLINAPAIFEHSGIHQVGDTYFYTYCTNFSHNVPGIGRGDIMGMESTNPHGALVGAEARVPQPESLLRGRWQQPPRLLHLPGRVVPDLPRDDARPRPQGQRNTAGFRNAHIDPVDIDADGTISEVVGTYEGVGQLATLDPYAGPMSAETIAWQAGTWQGYVGTASFEGQTPTPKLTSVHDSGWTSVAGADFGSDGTSALSARLLPKAGGFITLSTSPDPDKATSVLGTITVPAGDGETWSDLRVDLPTGSLTGVKDVFFRYCGTGAGELFDVETWTFTEKTATPEDPATPTPTVDLARARIGTALVPVKVDGKRRLRVTVRAGGIMPSGTVRIRLTGAGEQKS